MAKKIISKRTQKLSLGEILFNPSLYSERMPTSMPKVLDKQTLLAEAKNPILEIFKRTDIDPETTDGKENDPHFALVLVCPITVDITYKKINELLQEVWGQVESLRYYLREGKQRQPPGITTGENGIWSVAQRSDTIQGDKTGDEEIKIRINITDHKLPINGEIWRNISCEGLKKTLEEKAKQKLAQRARVNEYSDKIEKRKIRRGRKLQVPSELNNIWPTSKNQFSEEDRSLFQLAYIEQKFTLTEAAEKLGIKKSRATKICRSMLDKMGFSEQSDSEEIKAMFSNLEVYDRKLPDHE